MRYNLLAVLLSIVSFIYSAEIPEKKRIKRADYVSKFLRKNSVAAEIGVCTGAFSYHVLLKKEPSKLYLIDPWEYWPKRKAEYKRIQMKSKLKEQQYENVKALFSPFKNVELIRKTSVDAAACFPDRYFDYVYIDAEHSYEAVTDDLKKYFPKIKIGGLIIGDDFGWTGIAPAVREFVEKNSSRCKLIGEKYGQYVLKRIK